jgi:hypothetical protein
MQKIKKRLESNCKGRQGSIVQGNLTRVHEYNAAHFLFAGIGFMDFAEMRNDNE